MNEAEKGFYGIYADALMEKQNEINLEIKSILDSISTDSETRPAEYVASRIKSKNSIVEKLAKRELEQTAEAGLSQLSDIIGFRIVTHFIGDVYFILDKIKQSDKWQVINVKDYIANSKPNGYRSLHIILRVPFNCGNFETINIEFQLRTIAMDCWASLEHQLKYKKSVSNTEIIVQELKRCADEMASTDLSMQTIRELLQQ